MKTNLEKAIEEAISNLKASSDKAADELRIISKSTCDTLTNDALWDMLHCMSLLRAKHPESFESLKLNKRIKEASAIARANNLKLKNYESDLQD